MKASIESMLRKPALKPRQLFSSGTGALWDEQQFCFEKGWREGIAAYRKALRKMAEDMGLDDGPDVQVVLSGPTDEQVQRLIASFRNAEVQDV